MGIFDVFRSSKRRTKVTQVEETKEDLKKEEVIGQPKDYILSQERCAELLKHIFNDTDHGEAMMKEVSLAENIFVLGYIENIVMSDLRKQKKEKEYEWFKAAMMLFRKIFFDKVMKEEKLWKVVSKTTGFSFMDKGCEHILVSGDHTDNIISNLKKIYYDVAVVETSGAELMRDFEDLYRNGYSGMCFSDGVQRPYYFTKETLIKMEDAMSEKYLINPQTQFAIISYVQEMRRNVEYEGSKEVREKLEALVTQSLINTNYIVPMRKNEEGKTELPVYKAADTDEDTKPGIYVFTDKVEMQALKDTKMDLSEWEVSICNFAQLLKLMETADLSEICINCGSIDFIVKEESLQVINKKAVELGKQLNEQKENWEKNDLPKLLKDKNVPAIKDGKESLLFVRNKDSIFMSKFIFDILDRRDMKQDIMEFFLKDEEMESVSLYDIAMRRIILNTKKDCEKKGLFIMPMRYDGEDINETIEDDTMHYTEKALKINVKSDKAVSLDKKTMHFYTISNKQSDKVFLPIFSDENEASRLYPRDRFRYCMVCYEDIMERAAEYDGIVINPASMSFVIEKELLSNIHDIEKEDRPKK